MTPVPPTIARFIREAGGLALSGALVDNPTACEGAKFHSPRPLLVQEYVVTQVTLVACAGVTPQGEQTAWLCGTCADNVRVALALLAAHGGALPWQALREFGNSVRAIAQRAYAGETTA